MKTYYHLEFLDNCEKVILLIINKEECLYKKLAKEKLQGHGTP